jgi:hypothetical protein
MTRLGTTNQNAFALFHSAEVAMAGPPDDLVIERGKLHLERIRHTVL